MLNDSDLFLRLALATSLLALSACYSGVSDDGFAAASESEERVALLNPLDEALGLDTADTLPKFVAGQRALHIAVMPEEQRPKEIADAFVSVAPETVETWKVLEDDIDRAVEDFWLDVAQSPEFDTFRSQWLECVDEDFASQADVFEAIQGLHEGGDHDEAIALEAKAEACTSSLAESFNAAARPVYQAWADANAPLIHDYRSTVMSAATDFAAPSSE